MKHAASLLLNRQDSWDSTRLDSTRLCWCVYTAAAPIVSKPQSHCCVFVSLDWIGLDSTLLVCTHPRIDHEVPKGEWRYSSLSLTSALDGGGVDDTPRPLYPRERPGTHCTGGWVGLRPGLDSCNKSRHHQDSIPGPSGP
jgi:hypothetical protein